MPSANTQTKTRSPAKFEWPTIGVAVVTYGLFGLLTWHHAALPWWLLLPLGGCLVCLHGSLQHEAVHGHPTPWRAVNEALVFPSLWLWMPYRRYRELHLRHHATEHLTDPIDDPESYYVTAQAWQRRGPIGRALLWVQNTVPGRLLLGPLSGTLSYWRSDIALALKGAPGLALPWLLHLVGTALVLVWTAVICGMPVIDYILLFVYPGMSLTLLRSFLEHQAHREAGNRTVIIEAGPFFSFLFLNNNLHALHHAAPGAPWYELPREFRRHRAQLLAANGGYRYSGYGEIIARYLFRPKEAPAHAAALAK